MGVLSNGLYEAVTCFTIIYFELTAPSARLYIRSIKFVSSLVLLCIYVTVYLHNIVKYKSRVSLSAKSNLITCVFLSNSALLILPALTRGLLRILFPQYFSLFHETLSAISTVVGMSSNISMFNVLYTQAEHRCA